MENLSLDWYPILVIFDSLTSRYLCSYSQKISYSNITSFPKYLGSTMILPSNSKKM